MGHQLFVSALILAQMLGGFVHVPIGTVNPDGGTKNVIVVLKNDSSNPEAVAKDIEHQHGGSYDLVYDSAVKGFSATLPASKIDKIKQDPRVQYIADDNVVTMVPTIENRRTRTSPTPSLTGQVTPTGISRIGANQNSNKGDGVGVAVIDTGIDLTHPDLTPNLVKAGTNCIRRNRTPNDDNGHGTHVAGTIAAADNGIGVVGVASKAKLIPVKVLNGAGSGTWSSVICGIDWVTANASRYNIKVANMSLGGTGTSDNNCGLTNDDPLHQAICQSAAAGVTYVAAAGNSTSDASNFVPAAYSDTLITVSALADSDGKPGGFGPATSWGPDDTFASFSNYGPPVVIGAPGVDILSTYRGGRYATLSGTSMATPHVSGSAALYIKSHPGADWTAVRDGLIAAGEPLGFGHTDPTGLHPEPVVQANSL